MPLVGSIRHSSFVIFAAENAIAVYKCIMSRRGAQWSSGRIPRALVVAIIFLAFARPLKADETKPLLFI